MAPKNYKIEILDYWVEDYQGHRKVELLEKFDTDKVFFDRNDTEWKWIINYPVMNHGYYFRYRLIQ